MIRLFNGLFTSNCPSSQSRRPSCLDQRKFRKPTPWRLSALWWVSSAWAFCQLCTLNAAIGAKQYLEFALPSGSDASPTITPSGKIVVGANDGKIYLFDTTGVAQGGALTPTIFNAQASPFAAKEIHGSVVANAAGTRLYFRFC